MPPRTNTRVNSMRSLRHRRNLDIQISDDWRRQKSQSSRFASTDGLTPKLEPPAVFRNYDPDMKMVQTPKGMLHPLPGAFHNSRTLIIFDWDDTLCPTSWIRHILKDHLADQREWAFGNSSVDGVVEWQYQIPAWFGQPLPDLPNVRDAIQKLQRAVIDVITTAQSLGVVCIVTNAVDGWVHRTTKKWLPQLKPYILGHGAQPPISVLYGQTLYKQLAPKRRDLGFVDNQGELTWWKTTAMLEALGWVDALYRVAPARSNQRCEGPRSASSSPTLTPLASRIAAVDGAKGRTLTSLAAGSKVEENGEEQEGEQIQEPEQDREREQDDVLPKVKWQADRGSKQLVSMISIGDSEAEMSASKLATLVHQVGFQPEVPNANGNNSSSSTTTNGVASGSSNSDGGKVSTGRAARRRRPLSAPPANGGLREPGRPWVKNLKFWEAPSVDQIIEQITLLRLALPQLVASRAHLRIGPEELKATWCSGGTVPSASSSSGGGGGGSSGEGGDSGGTGAQEEDPDTRLQRLLRTQTA